MELSSLSVRDTAAEVADSGDVNRWKQPVTISNNAIFMSTSYSPTYQKKQHTMQVQLLTTHVELRTRPMIGHYPASASRLQRRPVAQMPTIVPPPAARVPNLATSSQNATPTRRLASHLRSRISRLLSTRFFPTAVLSSFSLRSLTSVSTFRCFFFCLTSSWLMCMVTCSSQRSVNSVCSAAVDRPEVTR